MMRRTLVAALGALVVALGTAGWAAEDEKKIVNGPSKTSFGALELILGQGASAETQYQPDASRLVVKTLVGEARIVTSARYLILVENTEGRVEILLPNGRVIQVEPGKSEIVGRAIVDDPGSITIRLSGTGPIAQAGGPPPGFLQTLAIVSVLTSGPAAAILPIQNPLLGQFHGGAPNPITSPRPESVSQSNP
jgi:hypothetical protein